MRIKLEDISEITTLSQEVAPSEEQERVVTIFGYFRDVKEEIGNVSKGRYLYIETNQKSEAVYISDEEFKRMLSRAKTKPSLNIPSSDIQVDIGPILAEKFNQKPDFKELMQFLRNKIGIDFKQDERIVEVFSDNGVFLQLPWEDIGDQDLCILRKVPGNKKINDPDLENNLLILLSHAYESIGKSLKNKMDEEVGGIFELIRLMTESEQQSFRMEKVLLLKHTTKQSLEHLDWDRYNHLHLIMHGLRNGGLCLENQDKTKYKQADILSIGDFLAILKEKSLNLIFLSFCFSGGGLDDDKDSLALELIKGCASKYVIGYSYPVGDSSAANFTKIFYEYLINGHRIEKVYELALKKYCNGSVKEYRPLLFMQQ